MKIIVTNNYDEMSKTAADIVKDVINETPNGLISFPGGTTPIGMVGAFVEMVNAGQLDISNTNYVSLDEWVGLSKTDEGSCGHFNEEHLFNPLQHTFKSAHLINGAAEDIELEKDALNQFIVEKGPISVSVLGIGLNGHLGFNEAGVDPELDAHIIALDDVTRTVMKKYFGETVHPTHGLTQGLRQIMSAQTVILIADGEHKADIIQRALQGPVTMDVPASVLQTHPNCYIILDKGAASKL